MIEDLGSFEYDERFYGWFDAEFGGQPHLSAKRIWDKAFRQETLLPLSPSSVGRVDREWG